MKISIEKIGKIHHSDIIIDGLTIIAGKNSTGKSTVSKSLFAIFNGSLSTVVGWIKTNIWRGQLMSSSFLYSERWKFVS